MLKYNIMYDLCLSSCVCVPHESKLNKIVIVLLFMTVLQKIINGS
jgi:hypothetical protein